MSLDRSTPLRRKTPLSRSGPKSEKAFERAYGSEERVRWVRHRPCIVCGARPCENAHTKAGGMGMKAGAETVVPLCPDHHRELHQRGQETFQGEHDVNLKAEAKRISHEWRQHHDG